VSVLLSVFSAVLANKRVHISDWPTLVIDIHPMTV